MKQQVPQAQQVVTQVLPLQVVLQKSLQAAFPLLVLHLVVLQAASHPQVPHQVVVLAVAQAVVLLQH